MLMDNELPELSAILLPMPMGGATTLTRHAPASSLRRSPRKLAAGKGNTMERNIDQRFLQSASSQQRSSPRKQVSSKRAHLKPAQAKKATTILEVVPELAPVSQKASPKSTFRETILIEDDSDDCLAVLTQPLKSLARRESRTEDVDSEKENSNRKTPGKKRQPTCAMSRITQAARNQVNKKKVETGRTRPAPKLSNPYISTEACCDDDLAERSSTDTEDEDTDLSGFIVDDDAEISFHDEENALSAEDSEPDVRPRRQATQPRRRLLRGRKKRESDLNESDDQGLSSAMNITNLGEKKLEQEKDAGRRKNLEVIDLTSSPVSEQSSVADGRSSHHAQDTEEITPSLIDPFTSFNTALQLQPSTKSATQLLPSKLGIFPASPQKASTSTTSRLERPSTPPATPPRSPSKLRSPTKLKSPSKQVSPAKKSKALRQSTDAFWDHEAVSEWTETYSPKKAPLLSPRKNPLARFDIFANDDLDNLSELETDPSNFPNSFNESSDSLPSPCDSPAKSRSPSKSAAFNAELVRVRDEKRAKIAAKRKFESEKHQMAKDLLTALDQNITSSKISALSRSTGGIQIVWSKTLRSTAGRANWKRTVTKPSGSPVKGNSDSNTIESQPGIVVQHFASIELAEKIIDRPDRLVNTLAHEFCHLANFMVSGIRDQPHGLSFQQWGKKVTSWLKSSTARKAVGWRQEWKLAEVTTKHSYVVETKYLWVCTGRPKERMSLAAKMLELESEDGCGAEYGRHSKSIDVEKQRCGVCKGFLTQVRPAPRAASPKKSPVKTSLRSLRTENSDGVRSLERLLQDVDLGE